MKHCSLFVSMIFLTVELSMGQVSLRGDLDGSQENPPVVTSAGGWAKITLNPDDTLSYEVRVLGLVGTASHIHEGDVGSNGGIVFPLSGGPTTWSGTTRVLAPGEIDILLDRGYYVNVHTAANPGGEIRGQIEVRADVFGAHLTDDQQVPPSGTSGIGAGDFVLNPDRTLSYDVTFGGLTGPPTNAHIHDGDFGSNGGIVFDIGSPPYIGATIPLTRDQIDALQNRSYYVNIHTAAFPGGEIRGQLISSGVPYGPNCAGSLGEATLSSSGAPMVGGTWTLNINGGLPSSTGLLIGSLTDGASIANSCPYLLGAPISFTSLPLNGTGAFSLPSVLPDFGFSFNVFFQFVGFDGAAPNGAFYITNGLVFPFADF